ncbi:MAG: hypothetical protein QM741_13400 [Rudaea sp.]|uniref:hypothetical protein n=1 Tax=Rudaea sp. TaxID=2136325 RepID=UPI0039E4F49C
MRTNIDRVAALEERSHLEESTMQVIELVGTEDERVHAAAVLGGETIVRGDDERLDVFRKRVDRYAASLDTGRRVRVARNRLGCSDAEQAERLARTIVKF